MLEVTICSSREPSCFKLSFDFWCSMFGLLLFRSDNGFEDMLMAVLGCGEELPAVSCFLS